METWTIVVILGSTVSAVVSILWGTHKIIKRAFEKRDEEIRHLLLSEQEFKDYKSSTSTCLMGVGKRISQAEERMSKVDDKIDRTSDKISNKLDVVNQSIIEHSTILARIDERIRSKQ